MTKRKRTLLIIFSVSLGTFLSLLILKWKKGYLSPEDYRMLILNMIFAVAIVFGIGIAVSIMRKKVEKEEEEKRKRNPK